MTERDDMPRARSLDGRLDVAAKCLEFSRRGLALAGRRGAAYVIETDAQTLRVRVFGYPSPDADTRRVRKVLARTVIFLGRKRAEHEHVAALVGDLRLHVRVLRTRVHIHNRSRSNLGNGL